MDQDLSDYEMALEMVPPIEEPHRYEDLLRRVRASVASGEPGSSSPPLESP